MEKQWEQQQESSGKHRWPQFLCFLSNCSWTIRVLGAPQFHAANHSANALRMLMLTTTLLAHLGLEAERELNASDAGQEQSNEAYAGRVHPLPPQRLGKRLWR